MWRAFNKLLAPNQPLGAGILPACWMALAVPDAEAAADTLLVGEPAILGDDDEAMVDNPPTPPAQGIEKDYSVAKDFEWALLFYHPHKQIQILVHKLIDRIEELIGKWELLDDDGHAVLSRIDAAGPGGRNGAFEHTGSSST